MKVETRDEFFSRLKEYEVDKMLEMEERREYFSTIFVTVRIPVDDFTECLSYAEAVHYQSYGADLDMICTMGFNDPDNAMRFRLRWG